MNSADVVAKGQRRPGPAVAMNKQQRHEHIVQLLRDRGRLEVVDLGNALGVTEMTVRRDLDELAAAGALKRVRGGATLPVGSGYEPPFAARARTNTEAKRAIARRVAEHVNDGDTVLLDGGSTGLAVAEALFDRALTICPLSLRIAAFLGSSGSVRLLVPGGAVRPGEQSFVGPDTIDYLELHRFDRYILTVSAISTDAGFMEWDPNDASVKRKACTVSADVIVAADSSKFGRTGFALIRSVDAARVIVTDTGINDTEVSAIEALGPAVERVTEFNQD